MKRKAIPIVLLCLLVMGCATYNITPARVYSETQTAYLNAWESYHKVWLALPETDPRKAEWVQKYHPKFLEAARMLQKYQVTPSMENEALLQMAVDACESILIQLAITKGGI